MSRENFIDVNASRYFPLFIWSDDIDLRTMARYSFSSIDQDQCATYLFIDVLRALLKDYYANLSTEFLFTAITVLVIDGIYSLRDTERTRQSLIFDLGSDDLSITKSAIRGLKHHKSWLSKKNWLEDGTLHNIDLQGADLTECNLRKADLQDALLCNAEIAKAILTEANLKNADMNLANLRETNLRKATLTRADLREADLREADLTKADLSAANLTGAIVDAKQLETANLQGATMPNGVVND